MPKGDKYQDLTLPYALMPGIVNETRLGEVMNRE